MATGTDPMSKREAKRLRRSVWCVKSDGGRVVVDVNEAMAVMALERRAARAEACVRACVLVLAFAAVVKAVARHAANKAADETIAQFERLMRERGLL